MPERAGNKAPKPADQAFITFDCFGKPVISKPRILIVVEQHQFFCIVVPITTYAHRGLTKELVVASQHAFVYTKHNGKAWSTSNAIRALDMLPEFIEVVSDDPTKPLLELCEGSMIDFGRPSTVHHNQETESFGNVLDHHRITLLRYFQAARAGPLVIPRPLGLSPVSAPDTQQATFSRISNLLEGPRPRIHKYISNNGGFEDQKDPDYHLQSSDFFEFGKVFQLLSWNEDPDDEASDLTDMVHGWAADGAPIIQMELRLLVIQEGVDSCQCLRISTYRGRGLSELPAGLSTTDHAIAHTGKHIPNLSPRERIVVEQEGQPAGSIRVKQFNREEKLPSQARILLTRVYNVQLDVKAKEFGYLTSDSECKLEAMFNQLNPSSTVKVQRPGKNSITSEQPQPSKSPTTAESGLLGEIKSKDAAKDASGDDLAIASSSSDISDVPDSSLPSQLYRPNDDVALRVGEDALSPKPYFIRCRIRTAALRRNKIGKVVWVYTLKYPHHDGEYLGEASFEDRFLMPI